MKTTRDPSDFIDLKCLASALIIPTTGAATPAQIATTNTIAEIQIIFPQNFRFCPSSVGVGAIIFCMERLL